MFIERSKLSMFWLCLAGTCALLWLAPKTRAQGFSDLMRPNNRDVGRLRADQVRRMTRQSARDSFSQETDHTDPNYYDVNDVNLPAVEIEPLSSIELLMSGRGPNDVSVDLKQYGYSIFQKKTTTFAPVTNIAVGPNYVVGPGDRFIITIWGRHNDQISVTVGRDGKIVLPEVGVLGVAGMSFGNLQDYIESELKRKYTDFKTHISMERLRTITIYVVGEAQIPASYTISAFGTALHALFAAGGPTKSGTLRNIQVIRAGKAIQQIDLYGLLMDGDTSEDIRLMDGDMIHIPLIGPVIAVAGNVRRPAIYEIKGKTSLDDVLKLAGGVNHAGWLQHLQVERVVRNTHRTIVDFDLSEVASRESRLNTLLQDGDIVKVYPVLEREEGVVFLDGHVLRPTKYQLRKGMRLSDVLYDSRIFLPQINLDYGQIERLVPPDLHRVVIGFDLGKLLAGEQSENKVLKNLDTVRLFRWDELQKRSVTISGAVYEPNEYPLIPGMRVKDLIETAGGLRKDAYVLNSEVTRHYVSQEGSRTEEVEIDLSRAIQFDPAHNILLQDYDHVVVRPIPEVDINDVVVMSGEVRFPGIYPISRNERLSSVLERAGGFTQEAYLKGAIFTRESAKVVQQQRITEMVQDLEESVLGELNEGVSQAADAESTEMQQAAMEAKQGFLERLREVEVSGRVVVKLDEITKFRGTPFDLLLEDGDQLEIPKIPGIVSVVGEVFNPTSLLYEPKRSVQYYLNRVGGLTKEGDKKQISIIRTDGSVMSMAQKGYHHITWDRQTRQWGAGRFLNVVLEPGDTIIVPRKLDRIFWLKNTRDITQIIFQMALALGVVIAL